MKKKYYFNKKKRFAFVQTALTALVVVMAVFLNAGVSMLVDRYGWQIDMTDSQLFTLSDKTCEFMDEVEMDVNIYFTVEEDAVKDENINLYYVYQTATRLSEKYDNVNVECVDIIKNPNHFKKYVENDKAKEIHTTDVIVDSGVDHRIYSLEAFFVFNDDGVCWAYNGEQKLVSAILSVTSAQKPIVCFTTMHGETVSEGAQALVTLFEDSGYEARPVDLSTEEIPEDTRIVVINDPKSDFAGFESEKGNEIDKLDAFLDDFGCLMVFADPDSAEKLVNLNEFLGEWGISMNGGTFMKDMDHSISVDGQSIFADYDKDSMGASLYLDLSELDTMPNTVLRHAMPLEILWEEGGDLSGAREVSPVLLSHESAVCVANGEEGEAERLPLMTVTRETRVIDNEYYYSYLLACGSAEFATNEFLTSNAYANRDIIYNAMRIMGRDSIIADIEFKVFDDTSLTITTKDANVWTVVLTAVPPVVFALAGVIVCVRRKNS